MGNCLRLGISKIGLAWTKRRMKMSVKRNTISILILGTQGVGKTTIALRLWKYKRALPDLNYVQTKGFNTYAIRRKSKGTINLYDLGGHPSIQELWEHYYADAHGVIFVVDVSNQESLHEAGDLFAKVLHDGRIRGKPILLLANKQDLGGASELELDGVMNLQEVVNAARCLTRLDESVATDLKSDKGIFEGFRWLISYVEKNYHEINDRVMQDILEEKNREKARRDEVKAGHGHDSIALPTKTFVRDESTLDLQKREVEDEEQPKEEKRVPEEFLPRPENGMITPHNYLIKPKSRPNSSFGEGNGLSSGLLFRNVNTAPEHRKRSLPASFSHNTVISGAIINPFLIPNTEASAQVVEKTPKLEPISLNHLEDLKDEVDTGVELPLPGVGRLSPEGADSDEAILQRTDKDKDNEEIAQRIEVLPSVPDSASWSNSKPFSSHEKLARTESSDTERASEILMVTTLAQVHQDFGSKGRRGSTDSQSVALSLSSFKSEDTMNSNFGYWKEEDSTSASSTPAPIPLPSVNTQGKVKTFSKQSLNQEDSKAKKGPNFGARFGKNKTAPGPQSTDLARNKGKVTQNERSAFAVNSGTPEGGRRGNGRRRNFASPGGRLKREDQGWTK